MAFLIGATTVVADVPWWAVVGLAVVWLVALALSLAWFSSRPRAVAALPVAVALVWFASVVGGVRLLGWS